MKRVRASTLGPAQVEELWTFLGRYSQRSRESFDQAFASLHHLICLRRPDGALSGVVATRFAHEIVEGRRADVLLVQWAVFAPEERGRGALERAFVQNVVGFALRYPWRRLYIVFGATTFKSYLALARHDVVFWPHRNRPWPAWERALVNQLMAGASEPGWDPEAGVVRRGGAIRFFEGTTHQPPAALDDPDLRHYVTLNPGHVEGDMLMVLLPMTLRTAATFIRDMLVHPFRPRVTPARTTP